ncbi:MAG TPA: prolipoprotein diacylglyceryl transferase family protein [Edaphobacter sp.]
MHPILFHLGFLNIPAYGALAAIGLMLALALSLRTGFTAGLNSDHLWNAGLFAIIMAFVFSRVLLVATNLHTFFSYPILLLMVPSLTPLGVLLTVLATGIYLRTHSLPILSALDAWAPCATLIWVFLALGHFTEGSDPGLPSHLPWAVVIPPGTMRLHPVAIYAAMAAALITIVLLFHLARRKHAGDTVILGLTLSGLAQFLLSFFREPAFYDNILGRLLDPLQWVALSMIVFAGILWQQPRKLVPHAL